MGVRQDDWSKEVEVRSKHHLKHKLLHALNWPVFRWSGSIRGYAGNLQHLICQRIKMPSCQILKNKDLYLWPLEKKIIRMGEAFSEKQSYTTTLCNFKTGGWVWTVLWPQSIGILFGRDMVDIREGSRVARLALMRLYLVFYLFPWFSILPYSCVYTFLGS